MQEPTFFFSYVREDSAFVLELATALRAAGARVWIDQLDIVAGQRWDAAVEDALEACEGTVVVLSPEAVASNNVMDEVSYALEQRKLVIPVLHRPCAIPFRLRRVQHVDLTRDPERGKAELLRALAARRPGPAAGDEAAEGLSRGTAGDGEPVVGRHGAGEPSPPRSWVRRWLVPLATQATCGAGLLLVDRALRRGWAYPLVFVYCVAVFGVCAGGAAWARGFCRDSASVVSFFAGVAVYLAGLVDVALGVRARASGRHARFWHAGAR